MNRQIIFEHSYSAEVTLGFLIISEIETGNIDEGKRLLGDHLAETGERRTISLFLIPAVASITDDPEPAMRVEEEIESILGLSHATAGWIGKACRTCLAQITILKNDGRNARNAVEMLEKNEREVPTGWNRDREALKGSLYALAGDFSHAESCFEDALAFCRNAGFRPELARTSRDYGKALLNLGANSPRAEEVLTEGLNIARTLGMKPLCGQLENLLQTAHTSQTQLHGGLTGRELEIVELVCRGYTNREIGEKLFISQHTAATHISNILEKTGMSNRSELTAYAFSKNLVE